jgi:glutamyl-tRNA(Gln) amidotransferase subunit E
MKIGLEIHQRLDSKEKLFCSCPSKTGKVKSAELVRTLNPSVGETGEVDVAALFEKRKQKTNHYNVFDDSSCLIECDEEPPKEINSEAFEIAILVCRLLNAEVVDEIHVMRKTVIDGSAVSGFQRTAMIGLNGKIQTSEGEVMIQTICLEEESSGIDGDRFNIDRLGIPLIEIATDAESIKTPAQAMSAALKIGELLRSTEKVQRGIGTIRQDLNVSIPGGARVEIKGVQELKLIPKLIENEVGRQENLLKLKRKIDFEEKDGKITVKELKEHEKKELTDYCRVLNAKFDGNTIQGSKEALDFIKLRLDSFQKGVPEETRKAVETETSYMRPLPGGSRMYPETDCLPLISTSYVQKAKSVEVVSLDERIESYEKLGLNKEMSTKISKGNYKLFEKIVETKVDAAFAAGVLAETLKSVERKGVKISEEKLEEFFNLYKKGVFSRSASEKVLELAGTEENLFEAVKKNGLEKFSKEKMKEIASQNSFEDAVRKYRLNVDARELREYYR